MTRRERMLHDPLIEQGAAPAGATAGRRTSIAACQSHRALVRAVTFGLLSVLSLLFLFGGSPSMAQGQRPPAAERPSTSRSRKSSPTCSASRRSSALLEEKLLYPVGNPGRRVRRRSQKATRCASTRSGCRSTASWSRTTSTASRNSTRCGAAASSACMSATCRPVQPPARGAGRRQAGGRRRIPPRRAVQPSSKGVNPRHGRPDTRVVPLGSPRRSTLGYW
jgi:hypothetical protein